MLFVETGFLDVPIAFVLRFYFLLGFCFCCFRVEGRCQILRPPVCWSGAPPFCLFDLAEPSDPFCVSNYNVLSFLEDN